MKVKVENGMIFVQHHGESGWTYTPADLAQRLAEGFERTPKADWFHPHAKDCAHALRAAVQQVRPAKAA